MNAVERDSSYASYLSIDNEIFFRKNMAHDIGKVKSYVAVKLKGNMQIMYNDLTKEDKL